MNGKRAPGRSLDEWLELVSMGKNRSLYLENSHTIEIEANGLRIRISNDVQPVLLKTLMDVLRESTC